jgi:hypothetical protein
LHLGVKLRFLLGKGLMHPISKFDRIERLWVLSATKAVCSAS